jgi:GNAT superfamily N-acetyltransferase
MPNSQSNQQAGAVNISLIEFSNKTRADRKLLKRFVDFHWDHYSNDPNFVPLLDYEYLGSRLFGVHGFFEPGSLFYRHADIQFFLALSDGRTVGRCAAYVNRNHNERWNDRVGFIGQFESIEDQGVAGALLGRAEAWLKSKGLDTIRGPQNLPVNEATPGVLTEGFDSRPVVYYHYNKPYYPSLLEEAGFHPIKQVFSWEVPVKNPMEKKLGDVARRVTERFKITVEPFGQRPLHERKSEMLEVYNDAWYDNFGFVPFTEDEFSNIIDDMKLIMDKDLFIFVYLDGELAAFFGGVPNIFELMRPPRWPRRFEPLRALKLFLTKGRAKGYRLGYLGVKRKFRRIGLDGIMILKQKAFSQRAGYEYCDAGWVLEDNAVTINLIKSMSGVPSKTYTIYEKAIE